VNIYDPADHILYVHMARETDPYSTPLYSGRTCNELPAGYANRSLRTRLEKTVQRQVVEPGMSDLDRRRLPGMSSSASSQRRNRTVTNFGCWSDLEIPVSTRAP
jgi:hypothetical protein